MSGAGPAIRGFLVQTLIALLDALKDKTPWTSVTLEPNRTSDKVDILWAYGDGSTKAVQVKSSQNPFRKAEVEQWAADLQKDKPAGRYELILVGPTTPAVATLGRVGDVVVPTPKHLDLATFKSDAAHQLHGLLPKLGLPPRTAKQLEDLVALLVENLASGSVTGQTLTRDGLCELLRGWISHSGGGVRVVRVLVAAPESVTAERAQLDEIVASLNSIEGESHQVRVEVFPWQGNVAPSTVSGGQRAGETARPIADVFLGILSASFGEGGAPEDFAKAASQWAKTGPPWVRFYFDDAPKAFRKSHEIQQHLQVTEFRESLEPHGVVCGYSGLRGRDEAFYEKVREHLCRLIHLLAPLPPGTPPAVPPPDPTRYLRHLQETCASIDVRGLNVGTERANRFPIEDLYISLTATGPAARDDGDGRERGPRGGRPKEPHDESFVAPREVPLQAALAHDRLVVVGDPGAGKTTFLRRIVNALCQTRLGDVPAAAEQRLGIADRTFPVFVRISDLAEHLRRHADDARAPASEAPAWLAHYLGCTSAASSWALDAAFFQQQLEAGACTVLLDGLDEAPDRRLRQRLSRLIESVTRTYPSCRFVVTSRPAAYSAEVVLPDFAHARIDPLSDAAVETFLSRWCEAVYANSRAAAQAHLQELLSAVRGRTDIRRMARNPVMLTALAVVHWNERRLPEQRADLYASIITWLSRAREQRPQRTTADHTVVLLQELALAMQDDPEGRKTQVPKRWAAEKIAGELGGGPITKDTVAAAERFLDEEEVDSGILVGRGNEVAYWHLTFQEFLAAKAIASRLDDQQRKILFADPNKVYLPDWREVVLLLSGALHQQGKAKVAGFLAGLLDGLGPAPALADQARCAGLIGSILQDLAPLKYEFPDARYPGLLDAVTAIFDPQRSQGVPLAERIAAADALGQAGDARLDLRRDDYWVTIPAGKFLMGAQSDNPHGPNYDPQSTYKDDWRETPHEVDLDAYRIARYPLTVGQYRQFVDDEGYQNERWWQAGGFGEHAGPDDWEDQLQYPSRPVVSVSWFEAMAFCAWAGVRLPTEAEWERAARGTAGRKYPWGMEPIDDHRANYGGGPGHPTPVGIYPLGSTPDEICDLAGNVWEWCEDWFAVYTADALSNPHGAPGGSSRVIRGGSWAVGAGSCRAAFRYGGGPSVRSLNLGFRLARAVSLASAAR